MQVGCEVKRSPLCEEQIIESRNGYDCSGIEVSINDSQSLYPAYKMNFVFDLFKEFAENPGREISGRFFWADYFVREDISDLLNHTTCSLICDALMASIFGTCRQRGERLRCRYSSIGNRKKKTEKLFKVFEDNELILIRSASPSDFFAYSMILQTQAESLGHQFLVIQYVEEGNINYRIFQSWWNQFTLNTYLEKNANVLNKEQFSYFCDEIKNSLEVQNWSQRLHQFYETYFHITPDLKEGEFTIPGNLTLNWGRASVQDVLNQQDAFERFASTEIFLSKCWVPKEESEPSI